MASRCADNPSVLIFNYLDESPKDISRLPEANDYINKYTDITTLHLVNGWGIYNTNGNEPFISLVLNGRIGDTQITELNMTIRGYINTDVAEILANYIFRNTSLNKLSLTYSNVTDGGINSWLRALSTKTNLTNLSIRFLGNQIDHGNFDINFHPVYDTIQRNTDLEYLSVALPSREYLPSVVPLRKNYDVLIQNVSTHKTLTHFEMLCGNDAAQVLDGLKRNTKLLSLDLRMRQMPNIPIMMRYNAKYNSFLSRNRSLIWKNVHPALLNFTLIFYKLPAYIILEIFDWLPRSSKLSETPGESAERSNKRIAEPHSESSVEWFTRHAKRINEDRQSYDEDRRSYDDAHIKKFIEQAAKLMEIEAAAKVEDENTSIMHLAPHYIKIQLIIKILKSVAAIASQIARRN